MSAYNKIKIVLDKYWHDPVWSKVFAAGIISVMASLLTTVYLSVASIYQKVPFSQVFNQLVDFLKDSSTLNNALILLGSTFLILSASKFIWRLRNDIRKVEKQLPEEKPEPKRELPRITMHSTVFVANRLTDAFPGQRGLEWYEPRLAVERLRIVFQEPLRFATKDIPYDCVSDPVWWFRGFSANSIDDFSVLSKTKVLLGPKEIEVKRIAVNISEAYYKCFIYVEAKAEKQTGLYNFKKEDIKDRIDEFGYSAEEYGLFKGKPIARAQYDDGATIIRGKVVDARAAKLRTRFLSDYNFIICAKQAPYNSKRFENVSKEFFNEILQGKRTTDEFFTFLDGFVKDEHYR